ncbi:MAG: hypothetical protein A3B37_00215 [Candidatus Sungbacteria bacterium RIFCSPLOWO2_01_FULL_59_16]|uniref:PE-PGRS family protein n=1 Tax=Candidatus Sungbacteria bacterium RIFCSPLOWO2_01_FULL_59_16 TaxID=1802280 RepID=A0A1G2LCE3_9BACT|nr:MAG: hypothetical protein A3B37_00215 [Candidatus Sungbacteria bacterium RIFCSPLOWO2_01_FULL_59_16]
MVKKLLTSSVLVPMLSFGFYAAPVLANGDGNVVIVKNENSAKVVNVVNTGADTGGNSADGGYGGGAGNGGSVTSSDDNNTGGNGGNGGNGGDGGIIVTGNADAKSVVINKVNTNVTEVDPCGCEDESVVVVKNKNRAKVINVVNTGADTGNNTANGGDTGNGGGNGGDVTNSDDDNTGGDGGNAGNGGWGGLIGTGNANAKTVIVNRVNRNITRIP